MGGRAGGGKDKFIGEIFEFYCNSTDCLPHDAGNLGTDY